MTIIEIVVGVYLSLRKSLIDTRGSEKFAVPEPFGFD
jgi:hypothetical protein